jgi:hypothetical protein
VAGVAKSKEYGNCSGPGLLKSSGPFDYKTNCNTLKCNGCVVLAISEALYARVNNVWYSNYPGSYPENEMGVTNFSIGANVHQSTLDRYAQTSGPVVARIYADECPYPPAAPPPPPINALCVDGDWPLFASQTLANDISPTNSSHPHSHFGDIYWMPNGFPGAQHAGPHVYCPIHSTMHNPFAPPQPFTPPNYPPPPSPPGYQK